MNHIDLFSGIGGFALAAHWAGFKTEVFCERDEFCQKLLKKHWPAVPVISDIREFDGTAYRGADLLTGGFPCQPFSTAGKRRGEADDRFLWPEMLRVISEARPTWIVGENVAGIINMALDGVLADLESEGYATQAFVLPACAVNAPHRRDRVWIVANHKQQGRRIECGMEKGWIDCNTDDYVMADPEHDGFFSATRSGEAARVEQQPGRAKESGGFKQSERGGSRQPVSDAMAYPPRFMRDRSGNAGEKRGDEYPDRSQYVADAHKSGLERRVSAILPERADQQSSGSCGPHDPGSADGRQFIAGLGNMADGLPPWMAGHFDREPKTPRVAVGVKQRAAKLKSLGNAIVPQVAYEILRRLL